SSGSVTVHADSTVQVLAGEAGAMGLRGLCEYPGARVPGHALRPLGSPWQTAKSNLEKAVSEVAAAPDEAAKAEAQIKVEANEALVKALE
ncbi:PREDICTED: ATP synthase subunit delta, mitochondrial, partial [Tauraco erythrolophus]|uniref:ATP synthase subunit delta, mitochondrial n=1 Tax=Tauraco erythrolophus TaxID=121530 RepID=UPI000523DF7E